MMSEYQKVEISVREKLIKAIERAIEQSAKYGLTDIIVPFKEANIILSILKEGVEDGR